MIFLRMNLVALKQIGFLEFMLEMVISNQLLGVEKRVFSLIFEFFLKSTKFYKLDKAKLQSFINFSYNPFIKSQPQDIQDFVLHKNIRKIRSCSNINALTTNENLDNKSQIVEKNIVEKNSNEKNFAEKNSNEKNIVEKNIVEKNIVEKNIVEKNIFEKKI